MLVVFQVPLLLHEIRVEKQTEMYPKIHRFNGYYPSIVFVSCAVFDLGNLVYRRPQIEQIDLCCVRYFLLRSNTGQCVISENEIV